MPVFRNTIHLRMKNGGSSSVFIGALILAEIVCSLESTMIYATLSLLYSEYGDPVKVGWLITAFTLSAAASAAIGGRLGDLFGRRRLLLILLVISFSGSIISAVTDSWELIILGRVLQGTTMAILPLCYGVLRELVEGDDVSIGVGMLGSVYSLMVGLGVVLGGLVVDYWKWQAIFLVSAAGAVLAFLAIAFFVPKSQAVSHSASLDVVGGVLFAPSIAAVLYAISEGSRGGWLGPPTIILVCGLLTLIYWGRYELRRADPLLDLRLFRRRSFTLVCLGMLLAGMGPMASTLVLLPLLQQPSWTGIGFGLPATTAGIIKLMGTVASGLCILGAGIIARQVGVRIVILIGIVGVVIGWATLALFHDLLWIVVGLIIVLLTPTIGVVNAMAPNIIIASVPADRTGEATGMLQVIRALGHAVGVQVIGYCLATSSVANSSGHGTFPSEPAFVLSFIAIGLFSALAFLMFVSLSRDSPTTRQLRAPTAR